MTKLRHAGVVVENIEKSIELYRDCFGFEVVWDEIESGSFIDEILGTEDVKVRTVKMRDKKSGMIELLQYFSHKPMKFDKSLIQTGCTHLALTVDNLDKILIDLRELGLKFISDPKVSDNGKAKVCFCRDIEGNFLELVQEL